MFPSESQKETSQLYVKTRQILSKVNILPHLFAVSNICNRNRKAPRVKHAYFAIDFVVVAFLFQAAITTCYTLVCWHYYSFLKVLGAGSLR